MFDKIPDSFNDTIYLERPHYNLCLKLQTRLTSKNLPGKSMS